MIGPIPPYSSGYGFDFAACAASRARTAAPQQAVAAAAPQAAASQSPVQPVNPLGKTAADTPSAGLPIREGVDPAEMAVRMRIQYVNDDAAEENRLKLPGDQTEGVDGAKNAQDVMEEGECQTCAERKYQDGSNDPGVSFKTAGHISPEASAATVRSHELEHVTRNQAKAEREGKEIVNQSVTLSTAICPECGTVYTSGGTTRTVYADAKEQETPQVKPAQGSFSAVA